MKAAPSVWLDECAVGYRAGITEAAASGGAQGRKARREGGPRRFGLGTQGLCEGMEWPGGKSQVRQDVAKTLGKTR